MECIEFLDYESDDNTEGTTVFIMDEARGNKEILLFEEKICHLEKILQHEIGQLKYEKPVVILDNKIYDFNLTKVPKTFEDYEIGHPQRFAELSKWSKKKSYYRIVHCDACNIDLLNGYVKYHEKTKKHEKNTKA